MKVYIAEDYQGMSRKAADILASQVTLKPDSVLGLATGSTPIGMYQQLVEWYKAGDLDFRHVKTVNLDEYVGLSPEHDQSYRYFMNHNLFDHININKENTHVPNGQTGRCPADECVSYDAQIQQMGGVDIQVLGLGHNGHIGFNEPNDSFVLGTNLVDLQQSTIDANARFFASKDEVPKQAITMGIGTIMKAKKILVVVSGEDKAAIVKTAFTGPVTPRVPASVLQLHPDVTLVGDVAALGKTFQAEAGTMIFC